eukprot:Plantae.Rhodophyta-Purpureofilum_apyrenoidigerum.ctg3018.p1 GENE.Plantae.Rhodophyta-Purpureofilum_apyrenoidigerum.ctg3018~~Plantae.Rhodophyta-Purpureofilum_apyrenoidigerum.ctg3018.p1  ORF type:complete len:312 (+),score=50.90 Plantae.Rhodophyta-Purpureofilum_apyrenoidigerum.ctg3018:77-1012(+)
MMGGALSFVPNVALSHHSKNALRRTRIRITATFEPGLYRRNKDLMSNEDFALWRQEIRQKSKQIPLVVDYDPVDVVYEDDDLIAVVKPNGITVHPAHRFMGGTLLNRVHGYLGSAPFTLHRLDQCTSGIILMAKRKGEALANIAKSFRDKTVRKEYLALVEDASSELPTSHIVDAPIARDATDKFARKISWEAEDRKESRTKVTFLSRGNRVALVHAEPITGRTHQIRLHLNHIGHPILGDAAYGQNGPWLSAAEYEARGKLHLHAWRLQFDHPLSRKRMDLRASPPDLFQRTAERSHIDLHSSMDLLSDD